MANTLQEVTPKLLSSGLLALRQQTVMPMFVNRRYDDMAGEQGSTIDVPIPSAIAAQRVVPGPTPPSTADIAPTSVPIKMTEWFEAPFYLTDQDVTQVMDGTIPMQASEAIKAIANVIDTSLLSLYKGIYGFVGTPGTTPFGGAQGTTPVTEARRVLTNQLAPKGDRYFVMDPDAEAAALNLQAFQYFLNSNDPNVQREGMIGRKFGFDFAHDQNVLTHVGGAAAGKTLGAAVAIGASTATTTAGTGNFVEGDVFTVAGDLQTYVVLPGTTATTLNFAPKAKTAWANNAAITVKGAHVVNLAFHRDAMAFASRPLASQNKRELGVITESVADPVSGLTLRLEITHEHKRVRYSFDALWGCALIRPELGVRIAG